MNSILKKQQALFLFFISFCLPRIAAQAQGFSYVYIQGDKKTPIYTKVEGVMMPRYGKNYALLSRLAPGPLNVEVLFQQNEHPAVQFNILVPENGKRAFVLQQKEGTSYLFDVEQNFYLKANNDISEDHLPSTISNKNLALNLEKNTLVKTPSDKEIALSTTQEPSATVATGELNKPTMEAAQQNGDTISNQSSKEPAFIEGIVFDNDKNNTLNEPATRQAKTDTTNPKVNSSEVGIGASELVTGSNTAISSTSIINSDCANIIATSAYSKITNNLLGKKNENERLGVILEACKNNCFSTAQSIEMLSKLDSDAAKLTAIKKLYPRVTDQANFGSVESILQDEEWKEHFRNSILQH